MKRIAAALLFVMLMTTITGCASVFTPTSTPTPSMTVTPAPTSTKTPIPVPLTIQLVNDYMAGKEIDISELKRAEFLEFSDILATRLNIRRGVNVVIYKDNLYFNEYNFTMWDYNGHPDQIETIVMYKPIVGFDPDKNFRVMNHAGDIVTIVGSNNAEWTTIITDPNDLELDWVNTGNFDEDGNSMLRQLIETEDLELFPVILMEKKPGEILIEGVEEIHSPWWAPTYQFFQVLTDRSGNPMVLRQFSAFPAPTWQYHKEGSPDNPTYTMAMMFENGVHYINDLDGSLFQENITKNRVYYLGVKTDQTSIYDEILISHFDNYSGIIDREDALSVISNPSENVNDYILFGGSLILEPARQ